MSSSNEAYQFTIVGGIVTAVLEFSDGIWKPKSIDSGETYTVDPADSRVVIKQGLEKGVLQTDRYLSTDGGQFYYEVDDDSDGDDSDDDGSEVEGDLYRFVIEGAAVVGASKFDGGVWKQIRLDSNESFALDPVLGAQRVIKTEVEKGITKIEVYEDLDGDGVFVELGDNGQSEDDVYVGTSAADAASGGAGADDLYGNEGDDDLYGDDGEDDLFGDDGNDELYGGFASDELYGGKGDDRLNGNADDDDLRGHEGNDELNGGQGDDSLQGGNGTDRLTGGLGLDRLTGGLAADAFIYLSKLESAVGARRDVIVDFNASQKDLINLTAIDANERVTGNQAFSWLGTRAFSGTAGQLRYFVASSPSGIVLQGDLNGDRAADFEIALLGVSVLGSSQVQL